MAGMLTVNIYEAHSIPTPKAVSVALPMSHLIFLALLGCNSITIQ